MYIGMALFGSGSYFPVGVFSSEEAFEQALSELRSVPVGKFTIKAELDENLEKKRINELIRGS